MKKEIEFEPIRDMRPGSIVALSIRPPGTWFDNRQYKVFVGGGGHGERRTLASAKKFLLAAAVAECRRRIAAAKLQAEHYEHELKKLLDRGLTRQRAT